MKFINSIIILFFIFFCPVGNYSQSNDSTEESHSQAIQFYIIDQVIAAYKYQSTERSSIRLTLNVSGLFKDEDSDEIEHRERTTDTIVYYSNNQHNNSNQFFEIKCQYLYNAKIHKIIQLFFGGGPFINYRFIQYEDWFESYYSNSEEISSGYGKRNENIWNIGISLVTGLECIVYDNINLFAEYEAVLTRGWRNIDDYSNNQTYATNNKYDTWGYELRGIRIGLGIYF